MGDGLPEVQVMGYVRKMRVQRMSHVRRLPLARGGAACVFLRWSVVHRRASTLVLGTVEAPDAKAAKAVAAIEFDLDEVQRNRIMVQELG
jgi:hypothetical protein